MKKIMIAAAALVAMTACNKTLIESPIADSEYGYINFGLSSDMEIVDTKAIVAQNGDGANYNVYLKKDNAYIWTSTVENKTVNYLEYGDIDVEDLTQPAGTYTIVAENFTKDEAEEGYGKVRVMGSNNVEVKPGENSEKVTVACTPVNAKVTVAFAEDFTSIFKSAVVTLIDGSRSLEMTPVTATLSNEAYTHSGEGADKTIAYFNVDESSNTATITWSIKANIGADTSFKTFTNSFTVEKNKWSMITFKAGKDGNVVFEIDATASINDPKKVTSEVDPLNPDKNN